MEAGGEAERQGGGVEEGGDTEEDKEKHRGQAVGRQQPVHVPRSEENKHEGGRQEVAEEGVEQVRGVVRGRLQPDRLVMRQAARQAVVQQQR